MTNEWDCKLDCNVRTLGTHRASSVTVHSEVRAEEQVSDCQEQRLSQWSGSIIVIQLICLKKDARKKLYLHVRTFRCLPK